MKCTLDTIKNNQWMVGSLAAVGLTAVGMVAHRLGLFALCTKGVSDACGHVAAVVSRHRFASVAIALVGVGMICLAAVAAVLRSGKGDASGSSQPRTLSSSPSSLSSQPRQALPPVTPKARLDQLIEGFTSIEELVKGENIPVVFWQCDKVIQNLNPRFGTINLQGENPLLEEMIVTVLTSYVNGEEIPFCEFFDPAYLTIKSEESNQAQSSQFPQEQALSILEAQWMTKYEELLSRIFTFYYSAIQNKKVLSGDSFSYRFEITIDDEKKHSVGHRKLD